MPLRGVATWEDAQDASAAEKKKSKSGGFQTMGLDKPLLDGILKMGYQVPTPIQRKAIPPMMQGTDVVAMARTGSGKTAAYLIPMLHHLKEHAKIVGIRGLVLSPTRELSLQIVANIRKLGRFLNLTTTALVGGQSLEKHFEMLAGNPDIVVASPGRLLHIMEEAHMQLAAVRVIILDEADRLFEQGLQPQIVAILQRIPDSSQRALFSATMPSVLAEFAQAGLHNPVVIRLDAEMKLSDKLRTASFIVRTEEKLGALMYTLKCVIKCDENNQSLVFVESKHHVDLLEGVLENYGITVSAVHGQMDQEARKLSVQGFSRKQSAVMVVTDVAARGIDLPLLDNVVNFSFPFTPKLFVHRVGRVARAGRAGAAYNILTVDDMPYYIDLMQFLDRPCLCEVKEGDLLQTADDGCYGRLPQDALRLEVDYVRRLSEEDADVGAQMKVANNAHSKYTKTKKKATREAMVEAHDGAHYRLDDIPIHPMLIPKMDQRLVQADAAKLALRKFKPKEGESYLNMVAGDPTPIKMSFTPKADKQRRLELIQAKPTTLTEMAATKAKAASGKKLSLAESMLLKSQERKRTREAAASQEDELDRILDEARRPTARDYRDGDFFLADQQEKETIANRHYSIKDATLDVVPESAEEMAQQRNVFAWNDKKNRYQKMHVNDAKALLHGIKNEAGKKINFKTKLDSYAKWMKSANMRIQDVGEEEDLSAVTKARAARKGEEVAEDDEDYADISDPNQGRKLRIGKKQKRLPSDGHVRDFEEMALQKRRAEKERAKQARKAGHARKKK